MKYAIFIISHKRADRVETYTTLKKAGYTDKLYVVVDDLDTQLEQYQKRFGDDLLVFHKHSFIRDTDTICVERKESSAVYARNAVEGFAKLFQLDVFGMFDDDITSLRYRWIEDNKIRSMRLNSQFDKVVDFYFDFLYSNNIAEVSMPTSPFYMCGVSKLEQKICDSRKGYGIHFRNTKYEMKWSSLLNEDLISQLLLGKVGYVYMTLPMICFETPMTDTDSGGVNDVYRTTSAFQRAFLANVALPSSCSAYTTHNTFVLHYDKQKTFPMIISSRYKK